MVNLINRIDKFLSEANTVCYNIDQIHEIEDIVINRIVPLMVRMHKAIDNNQDLPVDILKKTYPALDRLQSWVRELKNRS